jgi:hypothetical protein
VSVTQSGLIRGEIWPKLGGGGGGGGGDGDGSCLCLTLEGHTKHGSGPATLFPDDGPNRMGHPVMVPGKKAW